MRDLKNNTFYSLTHNCFLTFSIRLLNTFFSVTCNLILCIYCIMILVYIFLPISICIPFFNLAFIKCFLLTWTNSIKVQFHLIKPICGCENAQKASLEPIESTSITVKNKKLISIHVMYFMEPFEALKHAKSVLWGQSSWFPVTLRRLDAARSETGGREKQTAGVWNGGVGKTGWGSRGGRR